jgi:hypothetical protein
LGASRRCGSIVHHSGANHDDDVDNHHDIDNDYHHNVNFKLNNDNGSGNDDNRSSNINFHRGGHDDDQWAYELVDIFDDGPNNNDGDGR